IIFRLGRYQVDHSRGGVAAIKRALRTTQYLDPLDIIEFLLEKTVADKGRVVERDRHRRIGRRRHSLRADTPNLDGIAGEIGLTERDVRYLADQVGTTRDLPRRQVFLAERG